MKKVMDQSKTLPQLLQTLMKEMPQLLECKIFTIYLVNKAIRKRYDKEFPSGSNFTKKIVIDKTWITTHTTHNQTESW